MAIRFLPQCRVFGIRPELVVAMQVVDGVLAKDGVDLVVTSAVNGKHSNASLHYAGAAFDLRIWDIEDVYATAGKIREALTPEFDVVVEKSHIHIEFQPKLGHQ